MLGKIYGEPGEGEVRISGPVKTVVETLGGVNQVKKIKMMTALRKYN